MRRTALKIASLTALAVTLALPTTASAQPFPSPNDFSQWLQGAANGANANGGNGGSTPAPFPLPPIPIPRVPTNASCPPIEIAPGISVPVCASALPAPPPGFTLPEAILTAPAFIPPAVDLRTQNLDGPVKDQQQTGVCYAFALTTALESSLRRQGRQDVLSPLHVVASGAWDDLWHTQPTEAIGPEQSWPYDAVKACKFEKGPDECEQSYGVRAGSWQSEPALVNEREAHRGRGFAFVGKGSAIRRDPVQGITNALATGRMVYAHIEIDSRAWGWRGIQNGVLPEYEVADRGPHAVTLVAYRFVNGSRRFLIHNSWSRAWGENGYAWMTENGIRKHLKEAYLVDAILAGSGPVVNRPPTPTPTPSQQTCAAGTAIDAGTGKCATVCRSGLAPFMGKCWLG